MIHCEPPVKSETMALISFWSQSKFASNHCSSDESEERRALAGRALAPPQQRIDPEAAPGRGYNEQQLNDDQEHVGPGPLVWRVVESEPKINRHQCAERGAEPCRHAEDQRNGDPHLDDVHQWSEYRDIRQHEVAHQG